jgi:uncharacterized protein YycO
MQDLSRLKKALLVLVAIATCGSASGYIYFKATEAVAGSLPPLRTGDLVFQTITDSQASAIIVASASPYSHMGIINVDASGNTTVVEAIGPVREVDLDRWLAQGAGRRVTIKRLPELLESDANKVVEAARRYMGLPYDIHFLFDNNALYCSELAWLAFREGANIEIGKVEAIGELNTGNPVVTQLIKRRWESYEPCKTSGATSFEACYKLVMQQELVTPASMARDTKLDLVFSNYPLPNP